MKSKQRVASTRQGWLPIRPIRRPPFHSTSDASAGWTPARMAAPISEGTVPLLGNAEKAELEALILAKLTDHYEKHGSSALLIEGLRVVVNGSGVLLDSGETPHPLAAVGIRSLFTALCYVPGRTPALPPD